MARKLKVYTLMLSILMVLVTACGGNGGSNGGNGTGGSATTQTTSAGGSGPITVKDSKGSVTLNKPAQKVVTLEYTPAENLIALGVQPIGNADNKNYTKWITKDAPLGANVTDVGVRTEPNLESIASLQPDLIVADIDMHEKIYDQLKAIAPTLIYGRYPQESQEDQYQRMIDNFKSLAAAVGKSPEGDKVLADLDKHYADAKQKLAAAGKQDLNVVLAQAYTYQNAATIRLFKDNSMVVQILERIGLKNSWKSGGFEQKGFTTNTVESLPAVQNANFFYVVQSNDDIFATSLADNSVWKGLAFVKEKRTFALAETTWLFGGTVSAKAFVNQVVSVLTK